MLRIFLQLFQQVTWDIIELGYNGPFSDQKKYACYNRDSL
jgi:hypothetical protein